MDPVRGAWILLLALIGGVVLNSAFLFIGCAILVVPQMCAHTGEGLRDVTLEIITAISVLIAAGKERK